MHALVVDDSRATRSIISRILREIGFVTEEASNGREALDYLDSNPVPLAMIIDWNMPEMNGLDFVKVIRANRTLKDVRIIMITSENEMGRVQQALEAGADEYIMKPFTKEMIQEKLALVGLEVPLNPGTEAKG